MRDKLLQVNSLVDDDVIRALYKASQAGVQIDLIVRGICCLKPGVEGVSENIRVISIIGKYLEHPRAFYFKNDAAQVYISSADWMPRNLVRRIELLTAIKDDAAREKIIQILKLQCADNVLSYELQNDGTYIKRKKDNDKSVNSHKLLEDFVNRVSKATKNENAASISELTSKLFIEN